MRLPTLLGLARAEIRTTLRLVRYWIFVALSAFVGIVGFAYYAVIHGFFSAYSGSVGATNPRFMVAAVGSLYLLLFTLGLVFLAFDVRERDRRARMVEVLDSRPYSNAELLTGRFAGILFMAWLPVAGVAVLLSALGWLAQTLGWPAGVPPEPHSMLAFVFLMSLPGFAFYLGLTFLLSVLVRSRLLTALLSLGVAAFTVWISFRVPIIHQGLFDVYGAFTVAFPTDILAVLSPPEGYGHRLGYLLLGLALLALAVARHPRLDGGSRRQPLLAAAVLAPLGLLVLWGSTRTAPGIVANLDAWRAAHEAHRDDPVLDLESVTGSVSIEPARRLGLDLELRVAGPERLKAPVSTALFTLNPGLKVERVESAGRALDFSFEQGLLSVTLGEPLAPGSSARLAIAAAGTPEMFFGHLDASRRAWDADITSTQIFILGVATCIFDARYVGLMPGCHWLPTPGPDVGRDDPALRPPDFYTVDLEVTVPEGWLTAGPGRRREAPGAPAGTSRFRYAPQAPVPEVALMASRFESRAAEVEGVELEVLVDPGHASNLEVLAEAGDEIRNWAGERLREAAALGLPYPYDAFTLVETPYMLRGYGGGWRLDSTMAPPAMLLMREAGFPTTRFDSRFRDRQSFEEQEGGVARAMRVALADFFEADASGGNLFPGLARNFYLDQTAAEGPEATALNFVLQDLTTRVVTEREGFFSAHAFSSELNAIVGAAITEYMGTREQEGTTIASAIVRAIVDRPEVWDEAMGHALVDIEPADHPGRALDVLALKGMALSRCLLDGLGREKAGALIAELRRQHAGHSFTAADFDAAAAAAGVDIEGLVGDFLTQPDLPGFVASELRQVRLPDADGAPRYQVAFHLRNGEPVPGLLRLRYRVAEGEQEHPWEYTGPMRVAGDTAVEIGLVTSRPVRRLRVEPYLALNRRPFDLAVPKVDEEKTVDLEPFAGARPSGWRPPEAGFVVVDDLDEGFSVERDAAQASLRLAGQDADDVFLDHGIPARSILQPRGQAQSAWTREEDPRAYGHYRRTTAVVHGAQEEKSRAVFRSELTAGRWALDLYLPPVGSAPFTDGWTRGTYHVTVVTGGDSTELSFDAGAAEPGWNRIGELDLAAGEARVELSDRSDGVAVVADAIRWRPARTSDAAAETSP